VTFENAKKFDFAQGAVGQLLGFEDVLDFFDCHFLELLLSIFLFAIFLLIAKAIARIPSHQPFENHRSTSKATLNIFQFRNGTNFIISFNLNRFDFINNHLHLTASFIRYTFRSESIKLVSWMSYSFLIVWIISIIVGCHGIVVKDILEIFYKHSF